MLTEEQKKSLCDRIMVEKEESDSSRFFKRELINMLNSEDEMDRLIATNILELLFVFQSQGHSGFSARYAAGVFQRLVDFKPIRPLTGEDDEWTELDYGDSMRFQNKRCPAVFKRGDGTAYYTEAYVFRDPSGAYFTGAKSHKDITFPFVVPDEPEYIDVDEAGMAITPASIAADA